MRQSNAARPRPPAEILLIGITNLDAQRSPPVRLGSEVRQELRRATKSWRRAAIALTAPVTPNSQRGLALRCHR
jgi:hypothetical protein